MEVKLQRPYWVTVLASLKATRVMAGYCLEQDEDYCKEIYEDLNVIISEIERVMREKEKEE